VLIEVPVFEVRAPADGTLVVVSAARREELEERRLAGPVGPDDADALAAADEQVDAAEEGPSPSRGEEALGVEHDVPRAHRRGKPERDALGDLPDVLGPLEPLELAEHLAPALGLLRLLAGDVATDEVFRLADEGLLALHDRALPGEVLLAGDGVVRVLERVHAEAARAELHGDRAHVVEERAIVRDDEHRPLVADEKRLEPRDGVEVQVVGRLVEHEKVRAAREDDAEVEPPPLAAGERRHGPREVGVAEAELVGQDGDLALELVAPGEVVLIGQLRELVERARISGRRVVLGLRERLAQLDDVREAGQERAEDVPVGADLVRLPVVADGHAFADDGRAGVGLDLVRDEAEQGRLAGAVGRDERGPLPCREAEGDVLEQRVPPVAKAQVRDLEDGHGEDTTSPRSLTVSSNGATSRGSCRKNCSMRFILAMASSSSRSVPFAYAPRVTRSLLAS
jgi:hypothetical protein